MNWTDFVFTFNSLMTHDPFTSFSNWQLTGVDNYQYPTSITTFIILNEWTNFGLFDLGYSAYMDFFYETFVVLLHLSWNLNASVPIQTFSFSVTRKKVNDMRWGWINDDRIKKIPLKFITIPVFFSPLRTLPRIAMGSALWSNPSRNWVSVLLSF